MIHSVILESSYSLKCSFGSPQPFYYSVTVTPRSLGSVKFYLHSLLLQLEVVCDEQLLERCLYWKVFGSKMSTGILSPVLGENIIV